MTQADLTLDSSQGPRGEDGPALAKAGQALEAAAATGGPAVSFALFANGRTVPAVVHTLSHGVCWIDWRNAFEAARDSTRSLPIGSEEGLGFDRMLGLRSYGCFTAEGERTASAPEGAVVDQGRQCEKRSPTEIAVVLGIIEFLWRGECVFIRPRRTRSFWEAINHACLWWKTLADGGAAPRLCAWHARPLGGRSCPTGGFDCFWLGGKSCPTGDFGCFWLGGFWGSSGGGSSESHVDGQLPPPLDYLVSLR